MHRKFQPAYMLILGDDEANTTLYPFEQEMATKEQGLPSILSSMSYWMKSIPREQHPHLFHQRKNEGKRESNS